LKTGPFAQYSGKATKFLRDICDIFASVARKAKLRWASDSHCAGSDSVNLFYCRKSLRKYR
jgi:hypothetical protein